MLQGIAGQAGGPLNADPLGDAMKLVERARCRMTGGLAMRSLNLLFAFAGTFSATAGIAAGLMLNSRMPRPMSTAAATGSEAISPQTEALRPLFVAASAIRRIIQRIAGWSGW